MLAVTLPLLLLLAVVGEVAVRYRERHRAVLEGTMPLLYYRHGRLRHALVRDFDYAGRIHVNRQGFRGADVSLSPTPGTLRIMLVGSSTTFDPAVSGDRAAWPARLEYWLNELGTTRPVEVINAGVPGYSVYDDIVRLTTELYRYRPEIVVLYEGHNDLFGAFRSGASGVRSFTPTPGEVPVVTPWGHWLSRHSLLYGKLVARIQLFKFALAGRRALSGSKAGGASNAAAIDSGAALFERGVVAFVSVAQAWGIKVVIPTLVHMSGVGAVEEPDSTIHHIWSYTVPFAQPEEVLRGYVRYNDVLRRVAERFDATYVSTAGFGLVGREWYAEGDPIHFNDRGADRMARSVAGALSGEIAARQRSD